MAKYQDRDACAGARGSPSPAAATAHEMEALTPIDAEIYEIPAGHGGRIRRRRQGCRRALELRRGPADHQEDDRWPYEVQNHLAGLGRGRQRRCRCRDRQGHPGHQLVRTPLSRRSPTTRCASSSRRMAASSSRTAWCARAAGAEGRPALPLKIPMLRGLTAGPHRVRPCRARRRRAGQAVWPAHPSPTIRLSRGW